MISKYYFLLLLLLPLGAKSQKLDTAGVLQMVKNDMKGAKKLIREYTMDAKFPNGNKDHMAGICYLDTDDKLLYNSSNMFTVMYTGRWFYKADHKNKTVAVIDLRKEKNKKMKGIREKAVFKNADLDGFFDTVLIKTATIRQMKYEGSIYHISVDFPVSSMVKTLDIVYDTLNKLPVSTATLIWQPLQMTESGMKSVVVDIDCRNFKKMTEKNHYNVDSFFSYENHKIALKKYNNYKLTSKI